MPSPAAIAPSATLWTSRPTVRNDPRLGWWVTFLSLCGFVLESRFGAAAMAVCLFCWLPLVAAHPDRAVRIACRSALPWAFPLLAFASAVWSIEPALSAHAGLELLGFTLVALLMAQAVPLRDAMTALLLALLIGALLSIPLNQDTVIYDTGEVAMTGIFTSKNNFACFMCLLLITAAAVLCDRRQRKRFRAVAFVAFGDGLIMLVKAHSLGALVAGGAAIGTVAAVVAYAKVPRRARIPLLVVLSVLGCGLAGVAWIALQTGLRPSDLLVSMGKDASLTGRTFLWERAHDYIQQAPFLGVGFQAFWVQGHVEAEGLWRYAHVPARVGFHFHNLFYETAVELGWSGVLVFAATWLATCLRVARRCLTRPDAAYAFCAGLMIFFSMRMYLELDFLGPFSPGSLLLPLIWTVCAPAPVRPPGVPRTA